MKDTGLRHRLQQALKAWENLLPAVPAASAFRRPGLAFLEPGSSDKPGPGRRWKR
jgi:hypothetical protein